MQKGEYFANNPTIVKLFDDLEEYRNFCRYAYAYGYDGFVFDEKDLYEFTLSLNPAKSFARFFILDYFNDTYKTRPSQLTQMGRIFESNY